MKLRSMFIFCIILALTGIVAAQTSSITNTDLEIYRQDRLKAERDYRENYQKLGFPSPEELDRRREQKFAETVKLSEKLRKERIESEMFTAEQQASESRAVVYNRYVTSEPTPQYDNLGYFYSYGRRYPYRFRPQYTQPGYYAGGEFWPTGPRTQPQPLIQIRPR